MHLSLIQSWMWHIMVPPFFTLRWTWYHLDRALLFSWDKQQTILNSSISAPYPFPLLTRSRYDSHCWLIAFQSHRSLYCPLMPPTLTPTSSECISITTTTISVVEPGPLIVKRRLPFVSAVIYIRCYGFAVRPACLSVYICRRLDAEEKRASMSTEMPCLREKQWKRRNYVKVGCKEACKCATTVGRLNQLM